MIDYLRLKNFKCFRQETIPFGGLTVLAGMNGTGKSSVIQAILALYQWRGGCETSSPWSGPLVNLGSFRDVLHDEAADVEIRIEASLGDGETAFYEENRHSSGGDPTMHYDIPEQLSHGELYYLSADRLGPRTTLPYVERETAPLTPLGKRGDHVLEYLCHMGDARVDRAVRHHEEPEKTLATQANAWLGVVSPDTELTVKAIPEAECGVASYRFARTADVPSRAFRAVNVGFGLSYVLPPIVALLAPKQNRPEPRIHMVMIEHPEAHIHPAGQTSLAELAARAVASGSQVVLETHSDHLFDGVRLAVAEGILPPEQIVIHYFERTGLNVLITTPTLTGDGRLDVWPEGFFDQHERNLSRLIGRPHSQAQGR